MTGILSSGLLDLRSLQPWALQCSGQVEEQDTWPSAPIKVILVSFPEKSTATHVASFQDMSGTQEPSSLYRHQAGSR